MNADLRSLSRLIQPSPNPRARVPSTPLVLLVVAVILAGTLVASAESAALQLLGVDGGSRLRIALGQAVLGAGLFVAWAALSLVDWGSTP